MNAKYLSLALPGAEIVETGLLQTPAFASREVNLVLIGAMMESSQEQVISALLPYREKFAQRTEAGGVTLATGNAFEVFGQRIENEDDSTIDALGLLDFYAKRIRPSRHNSLYLGTFEGISVVGFNSRFSDVFGEEKPLFHTLRGIGRHPGTTEEGVRRNNFLGTYVQGPLLPLNPPFLRELLALIGAAEASVPFERAATAAYEARVREFTDAKNVIYS
jgi:CobQ-like glutamine amidotransferase family enzyme